MCAQKSEKKEQKKTVRAYKVAKIDSSPTHNYNGHIVAYIGIALILIHAQIK